MGVWSDWYSENAGKEKSLINAEFALKAADKAADSFGDIYAKLAGATFTGGISAPSYTATSSRNVKKNIKSFKKSALDIIKRINIVSFKYRKDKDPIPQIGFIAEDTDPLLSGKDQDSMRINTTIGILLKAVQELDEKIEKLKELNKNFNLKKANSKGEKK
jgi:hypothetical protein